MGFNRNTWSKDYTGSAGLKTLAKQDGKLKYGSKYKEPKKKQKES